MAEENIMTIHGSNYFSNGDQDNQNNNPTQMEDQQQIGQVHSLLRLMKISNEFVAIKDSMEMSPLPGNNVEFQHDYNIELRPQVGEFSQKMKATDLLMCLSLSADTSKHKVEELAEKAMDEVTKMFVGGDPLWQHDLDKGMEVLNMVEYKRKFNSNLDTTLDEIIKIIAVDAPLDLPNFDEIIVTSNNNNNKPSKEEDVVMQEQIKSLNNVHHGSREVNYVHMPAISIVEILMDVRLWSFVFSEMLSRTTVLGVLTPGTPETFDGAMQMMSAEYHAPSPLLATRQSCFARYCKELSSNTWAIVDISLGSLMENPLMNCKRRPSGCLIQGLPDGNTQVTWIEHTEAEIASIHPLFKSLVSSGIVFSAKQWVDTLSQQCQHLDMLIQYSLNTLIKEVSPFRVERLLRLAERMRREFYGATSATEGNGYKPISIKGGDDVLIKTLDSDDQSPGLLTVTTSSWFPFSAKKVFSFLGNEKNRTKWDALALKRASEEVFHVHSGQGPEDIVSITKMVDGKGRIDTFFLQEKHESAVASYVLFSPMTNDSLTTLSNHGNIDEIPLLPSGFAILSNKDSSQEEEDAGSIVTLSFQLLDKSSRAQNVPKRSIRKLYNLVNGALSSIRAALFEAPASANHAGVEGSLWLI
ncbi:homeobox-leucine zipper protein PROTODERMAL FACTOR 2-like [Chenopodium quinoa]|uniref:homeobox-leucine zipper protein PROTODERMAL FACTOR 2-like n=1 Tax=Chenopodium quinoa TaxID=63459 RepID=UPI000B77103C|nr:homeobox-leucine zipper protein PROTODERMAL FACTOR 2-like [Chenopodium quinoa]